MFNIVTVKCNNEFREVPASTLDMGTDPTDSELKTAVARHLGAPDDALNDMVVERTENVANSSS